MTTTPIITSPTGFEIKWELGNNEEGLGVPLQAGFSQMVAYVVGTNGVQNGSPQGITFQISVNGGVSWVNLMTFDPSFPTPMLNGQFAVYRGPIFGSLRATSGLGISIATDLDAILVLN